MSTERCSNPLAAPAHETNALASNTFHESESSVESFPGQHSLLRKIKLVPYRVARKLLTANSCYFFGVACNEVVASAPPAGMIVEFPSAERLRALSNKTGESIGNDLVSRLANREITCVGVTNADALLAFAWLAFKDVPAAFNHNGKTNTGLPLFLPDDTAYLFHAFVSPDHRGQRLYAAMVKHCATELPETGIKKIVLSTETTNSSAIKSVHRMGFRQIGTSQLLQCGPFVWAHYPPPMYGGVLTGKFIGHGGTLFGPAT